MPDSQIPEQSPKVSVRDTHSTRPKGRGLRAPLPWRIFSRAAGATLGLAAAGWVLFEEAVWNKIEAGMQALSRIPAIKTLEAKIASLPPVGAAVCFLVPMASLFPVKLAGIALMTHGHPFLGASVFLGGKITGTAFAARIFHLTEPSLRQIGWLSRAIDWVVGKKNAIKAYAARQPIVIHTKELIARLKKARKHWLQRKFIRELSKAKASDIIRANERRAEPTPAALKPNSDSSFQKPAARHSNRPAPETLPADHSAPVISLGAFRPKGASAPATGNNISETKPKA